MIAYIDGKITYKSASLLHLDVGGLGYEVQISLHTFSAIQNLESAKIFTCLLIKEDAHTLYGFFDLSEKALFLHLISVNGVGAGTARMMLSSLNPDEIKKAILNADVKLLESIKGIGAKTAQRITLELRDKIGKDKELMNSYNITQGKQPESNNVAQDALQALVNLGITRNMAESAISKAQKLQADSTIEQLIKNALKLI
jgi:Holliday junction DNA helicase RuvA